MIAERALHAGTTTAQVFGKRQKSASCCNLGIQMRAIRGALPPTSARRLLGFSCWLPCASIDRHLELSSLWSFVVSEHGARMEPRKERRRRPIDLAALMSKFFERHAHHCRRFLASFADAGEEAI